MYANATEYGSQSPAVIQLRSRCIEKPINADEIFKIAHEKQVQIYEQQMQRERQGDDGEEKDLEIVLLKNVSLRTYMDWIKETHHGIKPSFVPKNEKNLSIGDIVITELACMAHEIAYGVLMQSILYAIMKISWNLQGTIDLAPAKEIRWTNGRVKFPDGGLKTHDSVLPNLVIEIAYSESFKQLKENVHNWIQWTRHVRICIGIKIFVPNQQQQRKMILLYEDRQGMKQEIEFGIATAPPTLRIPVGVLYLIIPQELENIECLEIQLSPLRNKILEALR